MQEMVIIEFKIFDLFINKYTFKWKWEIQDKNALYFSRINIFNDSFQGIHKNTIVILFSKE